MAEENAVSDDAPVFAIDKIYLKDVSFESPNSPNCFMSTDQPDLDLNMNIEHRQVGEDAYEVILKVTIEAKIKEDALFLVEIQQAAVFLIKNIPEQNMAPIMGIECPNVLFPYAREAISDLTVKGGFQPLMLAPVNFAQMYTERNAAAAEAEA